MQQISESLSSVPYDDGMRTGRPSDHPRSDFGVRLTEARQRAGLSQAQLAEKVAADRRVVAHWERRSVTLKPEQLVALATALNTTTDELLGLKPAKSNGPTGKVRQVFEQVSRLPRKQQAKVVEFVEAFVIQKVAAQ
jgi:transcriptional regulator with XRE-family HTH domain